MKEIQLKVAEAIQDDVNKGIVRIDSNFMFEIGVRPGEIVEIEAERKTVAMVDRAYPGDIGLNIIRMDGIIRRNAKTGISETVKVRKASVKEAKKVTIAPAKKGFIIRAAPELFKQGLLGRAVVKGDIVSLGGSKRRTTMSPSPFFETDIFGMLEESMMGFGFGDVKFIIVSTEPKQPVIITDLTQVVYNPEAVEVDESKTLEVTYEDIGGLKDEITKIREMVELPLKHPEVFERLGIEAPKGVLLHGPPGTGKTLLAKAVANETNSNFLLINGPEIMSKYYGQSEQNLRKKFEDAEKNAPSIIFIDEIDAIATRREEAHGEVERRVVAQMLALMDGLKTRGRVVVIAATNVPNILDPALRRPGRFDREVEIGVPDKEGRLNILKIHTRNMPIDASLAAVGIEAPKKDIITKTIQHLEKVDLKQITKIIMDSNAIEPTLTKDEALLTIRKMLAKSSNNIPMPPEIRMLLFKLMSIELYSSGIARITEQEILDTISNRLVELRTETKIAVMIDDMVKEKMLNDIAEVTHGFVGADLSALAKEAAMIVLRRVLPELRLSEDEAIPKEVLEKLRITPSDFKEALRVVRPSAMREVLVDIPDIKWGSIGGLEQVKQELKEAVEWPLKHPESFRNLGVKPPRGILLYGPPGTGKTLLAKAVANESEANFILVKGPELISKWVGESEKGVRKVFDKARQVSPSIIFFDEVDSVAPRRDVSSDNKVTDRVVNQLLTELDGLEELHGVVVIAATNRPDILDTALLRPGRFDRIILVDIPNQKAREEVFEVHTKNMPKAKDVDLKALAAKTEGYVGADIEAICREAAILALREDIRAKEIPMQFFEKVLEKVKPSVTPDIRKAYADLQHYFSSAQGKRMKEEMPAYFG